MRCPTPFQDVYRELAARHDSILVDGQAVFHSRHPRGLLDDSLFNDGMHPSFEGHVMLAESILEELKRRGAFGWPSSLAAPRIDPDECAGHFDITTATWKEVCRFAAGFYRTTSRSATIPPSASPRRVSTRTPYAGSKPASARNRSASPGSESGRSAAGCHQAKRCPRPDGSFPRGDALRTGGEGCGGGGDRPGRVGARRPGRVPRAGLEARPEQVGTAWVGKVAIRASSCLRKSARASPSSPGWTCPTASNSSANLPSGRWVQKM